MRCGTPEAHLTDALSLWVSFKPSFWSAKSRLIWASVDLPRSCQALSLQALQRQMEARAARFFLGLWCIVDLHPRQTIGHMILPCPKRILRCAKRCFFVEAVRAEGPPRWAPRNQPAAFHPRLPCITSPNVALSIPLRFVRPSFEGALLWLARGAFTTVTSINQGSTEHFGRVPSVLGSLKGKVSRSLYRPLLGLHGVVRLISLSFREAAACGSWVVRPRAGGTPHRSPGDEAAAERAAGARRPAAFCFCAWRLVSQREASRKPAGSQQEASRKPAMPGSSWDGRAPITIIVGKR